MTHLVLLLVTLMVLEMIAVSSSGFTGNPADQQDIPGVSATFTCIIADPTRVPEWVIEKEGDNDVVLFFSESGKGFTYSSFSFSVATLMTTAAKEQNGTRVYCKFLLSTAEGVYQINSSKALLTVYGEPLPPHIITFNRSYNSVRLSWSLPWSFVNAPVTGYTIEMLNNDLEVLRTTSIGVDQMVHTFDGLTGGTIYILRVAAINGVGQGGWSNIVNITTAPEGGFTGNPADQQVILGESATFTCIIADPTRVPEWVIEKEGDTNVILSLTESGKGFTYSSFSSRVATLMTTAAKEQNVTYVYCKYLMSTAEGVSQINSSKALLTVYGEPLPPHLITFNRSYNSVRLSWSKPWSFVNAPLTGYTIEMLNNDLEVLRTTSIGVDQMHMVYTFDGLTGGTIYIFRVAAINGVGQGGWSNIVNITTVNVINPPPEDPYVHCPSIPLQQLHCDIAPHNITFDLTLPMEFIAFMSPDKKICSCVVRKAENCIPINIDNTLSGKKTARVQILCYCNQNNFTVRNTWVLWVPIYKI